MLDINIVTNFYCDIIIKFTIYFNKELYFKIEKFSNIEYAYIKGINLLKNILNINLLYLDDLNELSSILEKNYIYYVEFLNQIYSSKLVDNFELSIKDAVIFCYKKNVANINNINEARKLEFIDLNKLNLIIDLLNILLITINCNYEYKILYKTTNNFLHIETGCTFETNHFFVKNTSFINKIMKKIKSILFIDKNENKIIDNENFNIIHEFFLDLYNSIDYYFINNLSQTDKEKYYTNFYKLIDNYLSKRQYLIQNKIDDINKFLLLD
tara:strand:- start:39 stop:845 length:807 start_codon:yes stop_codon:yes gene_type:complete